jgi:hypothetical protein
MWTGQAPRQDGTTQRATMAIKDVEKGRLRSAVRRLAGTAAVATVDNEVSQLSRTSAPGGGRRPVCPAQGRVSGDIPSEEEIAAALKIFKPDTSPCLSQWIPRSWPPLYGCRRSSCCRRPDYRRDFLLPYKFGVEPVVRAVAVERALDRTLDRSYTQLTSLDFSYACNTVDRRDMTGHSRGTSSACSCAQAGRESGI